MDESILYMLLVYVSRGGSTHGGINLCERWQGKFKFSSVLGVLGNGVAFKVHSLEIPGSFELVNVTPVLQLVVVELGEGWVWEGRVGVYGWGARHECMKHAHSHSLYSLKVEDRKKDGHT